MSPAAAAILGNLIRDGLVARLKPSALRVYVVLISLHAPREQFWEDMPQLLRLTGLSRRWARGGLDQLYRAGLLIRWGEPDAPALMLVEKR